MKNIFVGNLKYETSEQDLMNLFSSYGAVERVHVVMDRDTGQSRGFAFVEMPVNAEADAAIEALNGYTLNGRTMNVNEARPKPANGGGGGFGGGRGGNRGGGGGGFGGGRGRREPRW
ncbi:MAG: RNA-binding protein [Bryobacteraceae bacterium]|nr:RNA-binding protein [Bryobacteraceae bacterium]